MRAGFSDGLAHGAAFVASEIVHDHDIAALERGDEHLLDIGREPLAVDGPSSTKGAVIASHRSAAIKVRVFQWPCGTLAIKR